MIPTCLTLSIIRYISRVKWSNPGKGVVPSPALWCSSYWKGSLQVTLDYGWQLLTLLNMDNFHAKNNPWLLEIGITSQYMVDGSPCGINAKVMDCGPKVSKFKLQSSYYVPFRTNTLRRSWNPFVPSPFPLWVKQYHFSST